MTSRRLCTFLLGGCAFGLDAVHVEEVVREQPVTPVPLAAPAVRGLTHLRGRIIPVLDLRVCIALEPRPAGTEGRLFILRTADDALALEVDRVLDVVDGSRFDPPPETLDPGVRALVEATCTLPGRLVLLLDLERVMALTGARPGVPAAAAA